MPKKYNYTRKTGRPPKWTKAKREEIIELLEKYIEENAIPIIAEFAYQNDIRKATLYEIPEFSYCIKKLIEKKEAQLEKLMLSGKAPPAAAIFSLKQLGWSDKKEIEHSTIDKDGKPTGIGIKFE